MGFVRVEKAARFVNRLVYAQVGKYALNLPRAFLCYKYDKPNTP